MHKGLNYTAIVISDLYDIYLQYVANYIHTGN